MTFATLTKKIAFTTSAIAVAGFVAAAPAQAATIAGWNFNTLTNPGPPSNANQLVYSPSSGAGTLTLGNVTSNATSGITNFGGTLVNAITGDVAGQALAIQGGITGGGTTTPNNGATLTFLVNLAGFFDPIFTFATLRTGAGFNNNQVSYSTDGTIFTSFGAAYNPAANTFAAQTFDFSTVNALDGAAAAYFRITLDGATNAAGNNRFDNVQINASPIPTPAMLPGLVGMGLSLLRKRKSAVA